MVVKLKHIDTNPIRCINKIEVSYMGIRMSVDQQTGNWFPAGKQWHAAIYADISHYENPDKWNFGLAAWGETRIEAIHNGFNFAQSNTVQFPSGWISAVIEALRNEA
jgi:hypothetical protein